MYLKMDLLIAVPSKSLAPIPCIHSMCPVLGSGVRALVSPSRNLFSAIVRIEIQRVGPDWVAGSRV